MPVVRRCMKDVNVQVLCLRLLNASSAQGFYWWLSRGENYIFTREHHCLWLLRQLLVTKVSVHVIHIFALHTFKVTKDSRQAPFFTIIIKVPLGKSVTFCSCLNIKWRFLSKDLFSLIAIIFYFSRRHFGGKIKSTYSMWRRQMSILTNHGSSCNWEG